MKTQDMKSRAIANKSMWKQTVLDAEAARRRRGDNTVILEKWVPWNQHFVRLGLDAYYIVYPASPGGWVLWCIPHSARGTWLRVPLPKRWAGLRDEALEKATGVSGVDFCHPDRYFVKATSKDAAVKCAEAALEQQLQAERREAAAELAATIKNVEAVRWLHTLRALFAG